MDLQVARKWIGLEPAALVCSEIQSLHIRNGCKRFHGASSSQSPSNSLMLAVCSYRHKLKFEQPGLATKEVRPSLVSYITLLTLTWKLERSSSCLHIPITLKYNKICSSTVLVFWCYTGCVIRLVRIYHQFWSK
jgi:hypothetical protein